MHTLIIGRTASGKTVLAKKLVSRTNQRGINALVLDPLNDPTWRESGASFVTRNNQEFLRVVWLNRKCVLVVDEAGEAIGRFSREMMVIATQSRHLGHKAYFITQRATQLDRTVRDQCVEHFVFACSVADSRDLYSDYGHECLRDAWKLPQGYCYHFTNFSEPKLLNVFGENKAIDAGANS